MVNKYLSPLYDKGISIKEYIDCAIKSALYTLVGIGLLLLFFVKRQERSEALQILITDYAKLSPLFLILSIAVLIFIYWPLSTFLPETLNKKSHKVLIFIMILIFNLGIAGSTLYRVLSV